MTPVALAEKYVELSRGNGKTTALIMSLPDEKCAVLANSQQDCDNIKNRVKELRPDYNIDNITFLVYTMGSGWRDKLLFRDMYVYIDHGVLDLNNVGLTKAINEVYGKQAND